MLRLHLAVQADRVRDRKSGVMRFRQILSLLSVLMVLLSLTTVASRSHVRPRVKPSRLFLLAEERFAHARRRFELARLVEQQDWATARALAADNLKSPVADETDQLLSEQLAGHSDGVRPSRDANAAPERPANPPRMKALKEPPARPQWICGSRALVSESNTRWDASRLALVTTFADKSAASVVGAHSPTAAQQPVDPALRLVHGWIRNGSAAGFGGFLYDNRDRGHSVLDTRRFPCVVRTHYAPEVIAAGGDRDLPVWHVFDRPAIRNASLAIVNTPDWRSLPRTLLHDDLQMQVAARNYEHGQLLICPSHHDFRRGDGDVYPANTPYWVISHGSSGSDLPFVEALVLSLAAMNSEVRGVLQERRQVSTTLQWLLRMSRREVTKDEDWFTAAAHPVVFDPAGLDVVKMVTLAHELTPDRLPPVVRLQVVEEEPGEPGRDYFHPHPAELLFNTPYAIARVHRTTARQRRMVVEASPSGHGPEVPLAFHWVVLQGGEESVRIKPLDAESRRVELTFLWQPPRTVPGHPQLTTSRIDIGVFASDGRTTSLPAFVCSFTLPNETREYDEHGRIRFVQYQRPDDGAPYVDPVLDVPKSWRDEYHYADDGALIGWTRFRPHASPEEFTAAGRLILSRTIDGRPDVTHAVSYEAVPLADGTQELRQVIVE